jgi:tetratricopeptide (TPR) repeat protein
MQALAKLQLCFQQDPRDLDTLGLLAQAFTAIGQAPKAIEVQKEMARIARELGQPELYRRLVNELSEVVPEDETVRALVRMSDPPPSAVDPDAEAGLDEDDDISEISVVEVDDEPSGKPRGPATSMPDVEVSAAAVEEIGNHELTDTNAYTARALSDADGFRQLRLYSKAVEILHIALELDPNSVVLRERVIELLAEAQDREGTINAMVALAAIHLENGNPELAKPIFEQVLEAEPEHEEALRLIAQAGGEAPLPSFDLDEAAVRPPAAVSPSTHAASSVMEAIEIVLEEAEFYVARGMHDDATALLLDQWGRTPNHPLLRERLEELGINPEASMARRLSRPPSARPTEGNYDVGSSLDALDRASRHSGVPAGDFAVEQVDVDQVFAKFKAGVKQQVSEGDSSTHYDLGVAYKEMGLLKDAISELELAARDPVKECMCYNMIGTIHLELGDLELAADAYLKGLGARSKTVEQEMNLYYDLGVIYEMTGNKEEALYYLKKIARRDPGYRDTQEKIAALEPKMSKAPAPTRAVNDDDEFDRAFGDIMKK